MPLVSAPSFLCMASNALEKSTDMCCLEMFCMYSMDDLVDSQNLWGCGSISLTAVVIFSVNFLCFRLDTIEKPGIINLSSDNSKHCATVVYGVNSLGKGEDVVFHLFF